MKYLYMLNRFQHQSNWADIARKLETASGKFQRDYQIRMIDTPEDVAGVIEEFKDRECVITAIGGDGSINLLLNDLVGTKCILSFLPEGTGNDFYRTCCETLSDGIHELDIIRINDRYYINNACFGIDADIANDDHFIHNPFIPQPLRYHAGVLHHFLSFKGGRRLKVLCDGEWIERDFMTIVAAGCRYYGGGYRISPASRPDDGLMEVYLIDLVPRIKMATMILSMKKGGHLKEPALHMFQTDQLKIVSDRPFQANIDGEPLLADSFDLQVIPKGIRVDFNREFIRYFRSL